MVPTLSRYLTSGSEIWSYLLLIGLIIFWWFFLRGIARLLKLRQHRPGRVVIFAHWAFFLVGTILLFNLMLVPVVLVAFHGVAPICLLICTVAALVYLARVDDRDDLSTTSVSPTNDRIFTTAPRRRTSQQNPFE